MALEPIRIDKCTLCSERVKDEYHDCPQDDVEVSGLSYKCLGCLKKFTSLVDFSEHISVTHIDDADDMTFRTVHGELLLKTYFYLKLAAHSGFSKSQWKFHCDLQDKTYALFQNFSHLCTTFYPKFSVKQ